MDRSRGMSLMDTLVGGALMALVFLGVVGVLQLSLDVVANNRARAGALALGNERMEYLRSLSYPQIGVLGGIPAGIVPQDETVTQNGISYLRRTRVWYSDDPGDGLGGADANSIISDFKTIRVEVSWAARSGSRSIVLVGRVSPNGIEQAATGGVLTIRAVNEAGQPVSGARVDITNLTTAPTINTYSFTNIDGLVSYIGAPASSEYQIRVSKNGYSSAQTYDVSVANPNPNPRHLTVVNDQTTSASFTIDYTASKTIETYMAIRDGAWEDLFATGDMITLTASTTLVGGALSLVEQAGVFDTSGSARSTSIAPATLASWEAFNAVVSVPIGTGFLFRFLDAANDTLLPENVLAGNSAGFATTSVDLSGVSPSLYPSLKIETILSGDTSATPLIEEYALSYTYGPTRLGALSVLLRGTKTIGVDPIVYKYSETHDSTSSGDIALTALEADTYHLSIPSTAYTLAEVCALQPETLAPAASQTTRVYVLPSSAHSLRVVVQAAAPIEGAAVSLSATGFDETKQTGACGQTFFDALTAETYSLVVSKNGYADYNATVPVSATTTHNVTLVPL
jgi:hypothetical protein